jgi:serine/threonine protein kinase
MGAPNSDRQQTPFTHHQYTSLERIKAAGMAEIFTAVRQEDGQFVTLKRILPVLANDEDFIQMFADEAQVMSRFSHPNLPVFYDFGKDDLGLFLTMEHIEGCELSEIKQRLPYGLVAFIGAKVASALAYAQSLLDKEGQSIELIHRNICPSNVMVSTQGEVKLIDFGMSKFSSQIHSTKAGIIKGKFGYMSPEQTLGKRLDPRTDIFALGIVLYELLSGKRLFLGDSDFETLELARAAQIPSLKDLRKDVPEKLESIIYQCLARDPSNRYQQASELAEDLQAIADKLIPQHQQAATLASILIK